MPIQDTFLPEFDHEMATTRRLLERVPEDRLDWAPHPKSMTLGRLAGHLVEIPTWIRTTLDKDSHDLAGADPTEVEAKRPKHTSRAALLEAFDEATKTARALIASKTDEDLGKPWLLRNGGRTIVSMPRTGVLRSFLMNHLIHHRGQLSVYLRLLDVPVPAMYGPSADEGVGAPPEATRR